MHGKFPFVVNKNRFSSAKSVIDRYIEGLSVRNSMRIIRKKSSKSRRFTVLKGKLPGKKHESPPKKQTVKSPWTRKLETEEYSQRLGYKLNVQPIVQEKLIQKTLGGPGNYDVKLDTAKKYTMQPGKVFTTSKRWDPVEKSQGPPVGSHNANIFKNSSVIKKRLSNVPEFEWDGIKERFKRPYDQKWKLPPNIYNPKDEGSIEALLSKVVSIRGPYDNFTGPRDGSTIKNHFSVYPTEGTDTLYDKEDGMDYLLKHPRKKNYGILYNKPHVFLEKPPCWKDHIHNNSCHISAPERPGPATYNVNWHTIKRAKRSKVAFGSSVKHLRPHDRETIQPGPGRYFCNGTATKAQKRTYTPTFHSKSRKHGSENLHEAKKTTSGH